MKKILSIVLVLLLVLNIVACGSNDDTNQSNEDNTKQTDVNTTDNHTTEPSNQDSTTVEKPKDTEVHIPGEEIYFTVPAGWDVEDENLSMIISQNKDCLVSICYEWPMSNDYDLVEKIPTLGYFFTADADSESQGNIRNSTIEIVSSENATIANIEGIQFTGSVNNERGWKCHTYGYIFTIDDVIVMVTGLVSAQAQDAQMIAEINSLTDQVAASVRTVK